MDLQGELSLVRLIDAVCVDPEVLQTVLLGLLPTEVNLFIAKLVLVVVFREVYKSHLVSKCPPSVRKYSIGRYRFVAEADDRKVTNFFVL